MRLLTYNIHKCLGGLDLRYRPDRVATVIAHHDPDVVLLQEVAIPWRASRSHPQADLLGDMLGYRHRAFYANWRKPLQGVYGNAILSRFPITQSRNIDLRISLKKRRSAVHARARVRVGRRTRSLHLYNLHLGLSGLERRLQLERLLRCHDFTRHHVLTPIVIAGDLNDVYGTLGAKVLGPAGFRCPAGPMKTYPAWAPVRALDGVYVRGSLDVEHVHRSRLGVARNASDHLPVVVDLVLR